ncbi:sigma-54 dependent transcriptional regulator [Labilibaculum sp. DW002]|uniref:Sigma-54 dependent transcriptional regulator n=1 Tax=Paralabilibaculum antarcticum TaxID=2912572 RepID=A0ABT5VV62_9BACT|nr:MULTISPECIES: sigma-54 dependent transcriptional regulator [unclassified Labilibaculum]MBI9057861.1 sigma-54-dependent Fis family transcriptional regulator [Labilibaculum sp.]MDE5419222.1 sigma-54 dependent transcriptional regulator [Labilibaculum sp. DW002]|eukprot:TRINITY_DN1605_c3_g1_i1.p1 TRINITY_DN1605_c3_g1~~TRINITY_DN1605_c3_g1_i1.p1  ORF type:complete len:451 (-),score=69.82 TRINITY_DN1605_c3_g1_i1:314-1666(-)
MKKILIIDDDPTICLMLQGLLKRKGFDADTVFSAGEALKRLENIQFDLVLSDFRLPDFDGLELLQKIKAMHPHVPVIIMTSYADIRTAVNAIKMGAYEYVTKPLNPDEILLLINSALEKSEEPKSSKKTKEKKKKDEIEFVRGNSSNSLQIDQYIKLVAPTDMSVIIEGESGTGKEIAARRIHHDSKRKKKAFVAVDCGALSNDLAGSELFGHIKGSFTGAINDKEGQFEAAQGGTLFLDEIGNLSYEIQIKLLRALQERKVRRIGSNKDIDVDVRIVVATNEDLSVSVNKGDFREDLYHRLNEFKITVPALRDRNADIELFAKYFLDLSNHELNKEISGFSAEVLEKFKSYSWPGNLREMRNVVRRSVLLSPGEEVELISLPNEILKDSAASNIIVEGSNLKLIQAANEKELIISTLRKVNYNKSKAARMLNIDRKTLYNKIKQYGIEI